MSNDGEKELQIELTRLQIEHENDMSTYTIFLSVFVSLVTTSLAVFFVLGFTFGIPLLMEISIVYNIFPISLSVWLAFKIVQQKRKLKKQIKELKEKYLWR